MVKIIYSYFISSLLSGSLAVQAQQLSQTIRGTIQDKVLQIPLEGAQIIVLGTDPLQGDATDKKGHFSIENIPIGRYDIQISYMGYRPVCLANIQVISAKETLLDIAMEEDVIAIQEVIVTDKDQSTTFQENAVNSVQSIRPEEVNRFAGTRQDPSRMVTGYAGVVGGGDQRNDIIVRGNSPLGVLWRLEGVDIPAPNHFAVAGNPGGVFSILNNNLLATSNFMTGAFPAEYGNRSAAVFDLRLRKGNNEKREYTLQVGLNGLEGGVEGPIGNNRGSYLVNGRFFYTAILDALGVELGTSGIPKFMDGTFKVFMPTKHAGTFNVWAMGGESHLLNKQSAADTSEWTDNPVEDDDFGSAMFATGLSHSLLYGPQTLGKISIAYSGFGSSNKQQLVYLNDSSALSEELKFSESHLSLDYTVDHKFNNKIYLSSGLKHKVITYAYHMKEGDENSPGFEYPLDEEATESFLSSAYGQVNWQPAADWRFIIGLYSQYVHLNNTWALEPRLSAAYALTPQQTLTVAYGMHSQTHPLLYYNWRTEDSTGHYDRTNADLDLLRAHHVVLGYQWLMNANWSLKIELYYQYLYDIPVSDEPEDEYYAYINLGADFSFDGRGQVVNKGIGYNTGIELTLERYFDADYYLLFTASLFDSKFQGAQGNWYNTAFNANYVFNGLFGKEWQLGDRKDKTISVDLRATYAGNKRYIPIDLEESITQGDEVLEEEHAYEKRYPDYLRIDFKISYNIHKRRSTHQLFMAADNVTNYKNVLYKHYDSEEQKIKTHYQFGVFPYLGYRVNF